MNTIREFLSKHLAFIRNLNKLKQASEQPCEVNPLDGKYAHLFCEHSGRVIHKWKHYFSIYDEIFDFYLKNREKNSDALTPIKFLEIGVDRGGSLEIWHKYFDSGTVIFGIDIKEECRNINEKAFQVRIGSQDDPEFLRLVVSEMGGVDIILDDGSHIAKHQRKSFDVLFPMLSEGGIYIIEDTHTAYQRHWGGGYLRRGSIIQVTKHMIDGLHKDYFRFPLGRRAQLAHKDIRSIRYYDSIIAIQKEKRSTTGVLIAGHETHKEIYER
jgi:hypothetical protein